MTDGGRSGRRRLAILGLLVSVAACSPPPEPEAVELRVPVTVEAVAAGAVEDRILATGTLRAPESAVVRTETAGFLTIARAGGERLAEGDSVRAGQTLAEIRGDDVRLSSRLEVTRQRYLTAQEELLSRQRLFGDGLISREELSQAEARLTEARLELERSQLTEERTKLSSPIGGVLLHLARDEDGLPLADGQRVEAGLTVAQVAPLGRLVAEVELLGQDLAKVEAGMPARLRHHAWGDEVFEGVVTRLAPTIDPATRTFRAEVAVTNDAVDGETRRLRPGMFVEVTLVAERREGVPVIPREALTERGGERVVFVLDGQRVSQRAVVPGLGDDETVEIKSGLAIGERIVVRGLETLTDGTRVRVSGES